MASDGPLPGRPFNGDPLFRMWYPAHIDVVIRARRSLPGGYDVVESGLLEHNGETLHLVGDHGSRAVTDVDLNSLQPVSSKSGISACRGFDCFLLRVADAG